MLNERGKSGGPCLILDLKGKTSLFTVECDVIYGLVICGLCCIEVYSFSARLVESFYPKQMLNVTCFFCICWNSHKICTFLFVTTGYHVDWVADVESSLHPWKKFTWSWCMTFWMYCWVHFANILFRMSAVLCSSGILACNFFSCGILILFWYQDSAGLVELIWKSSFLFGGRVWKRPVLILPWLFGGIHQGSHLVQNFCLVGGFWLLIQSP